ncbi:MAG: ROK family transcriptional regulator [Desulfobacula sp.]|uniref:ROK family transcriptional regulator n=1 Tax=Desulfobacula sp. TaxID=2593537 RepID=UPI0025B86913|nr:ROK family transcriptional regulator [Desulfobacula sp.]MCD4722341.1 ROK family transcriptional regulator [Desulfobacula sp.]
MAVADRDLIKEINQFNILNTIRGKKSISRIELAQITGQSRASVTNITARLIENNLIYEKEIKDSNQRGRKRVMLALNADAAYVVGIKVSAFMISCAVTDMQADIRSSVDLPVRTSNKPVEFIADLIEEGVSYCISQAGLTPSMISGIGTGIPGLIDRKKGINHWTLFYQKDNVPLRELIQERFDIPVWVENDANTVTLAHQWFGHGRGIDNFLVVTIEDGVGMGIVVNGQLYTGEKGMAAEFGHVVVKPGGNPCRCGKKGCLEAYVSNFSIISQAADILKQDRTLLKYEQVIDAANKGNLKIKKIFNHAGEILGTGISGLIQIFSPKRIIFSGRGVESKDLLFEPMRKRLKSLTNKDVFQNCEIVIQKFCDTDWARGAASLALQELYKSPLDRIVPKI